MRPIENLTRSRATSPGSHPSSPRVHIHALLAHAGVSPSNGTPKEGPSQRREGKPMQRPRESSRPRLSPSRPSPQSARPLSLDLLTSVLGRLLEIAPAQHRPRPLFAP